MTKESILEMIAKLHAKAEDSAIGPDEAEAFAAKVNELLTKHEIEMSTVDQALRDKDDPWGDEYFRVGNKMKRVRWQEQLGNAVAYAHFCRQLTVAGSDSLYVFGRQIDREICIWMTTKLIREASILSEKAYNKFYWECEKNGEAGRAKGYRASWIEGFVLALQRRFREIRRAAEQKSAGSGTALMVIKNQVTTAYDNFYTDDKGKSTIKTAESLEGQYGGNDAGSVAGYQAGKGIGIGRPISEASKGFKQLRRGS